jgi:hypothetical protein
MKFLGLISSDCCYGCSHCFLLMFFSLSAYSEIQGSMATEAVSATSSTACYPGATQAPRADKAGRGEPTDHGEEIEHTAPGHLAGRLDDASMLFDGMVARRAASYTKCSSQAREIEKPVLCIGLDRSTEGTTSRCTSETSPTHRDPSRLPSYLDVLFCRLRLGMNLPLALGKSMSRPQDKRCVNLFETATGALLSRQP